MDRVDQCPTCKGSGCESGTTPEVCSQCGGTGTVQQRRQTPMGVFATTTTCPKCGGRGKIIHNPCKDCGGTGQQRKRRTIQVNIPAGIDNGQTISLRGQGSAGKNGGPAGDLLITVTVRPHQLFRREGNDVLCEAPITFTQAVLGGEMEIPTIDGKGQVRHPRGDPDRHHLPPAGEGHPQPERAGPGGPVRHGLYRDAPEPEPGAEGGAEEVQPVPGGAQLRAAQEFLLQIQEINRARKHPCIQSTTTFTPTVPGTAPPPWRTWPPRRWARDWERSALPITWTWPSPERRLPPLTRRGWPPRTAWRWSGGGSASPSVWDWSWGRWWRTLPRPTACWPWRRPWTLSSAPGT